MNISDTPITTAMVSLTIINNKAKILGEMASQQSRCIEKTLKFRKIDLEGKVKAINDLVRVLWPNVPCEHAKSTMLLCSVVLKQWQKR